MTFRIRHSFLIVPTIALLLAVGCAKPTLTVSEYADWRCNQSADNPMEGNTYGEAAEAWGEIVAEMEAINPPPLFKEYHGDFVDAFEILVALFREKPSEEKMNPFLMMEEPKMMAFGFAANAADEKLSADARRALIAAGCDLN